MKATNSRLRLHLSCSRCRSASSLLLSTCSRRFRYGKITIPVPGDESAGSGKSRPVRLCRTAARLRADRGQFNVARFRARGSGYSLFLTDGEAVFRLRRSPRAHAAKSGAAAETTLRMKLLGANPQPQIAGEDGLPGTVNYFRGSDPTRGRTNVPTYAKVRYSRVYPGIDLLYYGNQRRLEYDFVVAPRADPGRIMLAFAGAKRARLNSTGDLKLELESGSLRWRRPVCYQEIGGKRRYVPGNYILKGRNQIGFQVAKYDRSRRWLSIRCWSTARISAAAAATMGEPSRGRRRKCLRCRNHHLRQLPDDAGSVFGFLQW